MQFPSRQVARRESLENYINDLKKLENLADSFSGGKNHLLFRRERNQIIEKLKRSYRKPFTLSEIARKVEQELDYPGQIKVMVIRETRAVEFAK